MAEQKVIPPEKQPAMTVEQFNQGMQILQGYIKKLDILIKGTHVLLTWDLDFGDKDIAKNFAQSMRATYGQ